MGSTPTPSFRITEEHISMIGVEDKEICRSCGGKCCKALPGSLVPRDIGEVTVPALVELFNTGLYSIDWWEGDPREEKDEIDQAYFIRPRIKGTRKLFDGAWGGECIFLTDAGCKFQLKDRPSQCRTLKPTEGERCVGAHGKNYYAILWLPYTDLILEAASQC